MSNISRMAGPSGSSGWFFSEGRSNHSDQNRSNMTRAEAAARHDDKVASHKADRHDGTAQVAAQVAEWLSGLSGADLFDATVLLVETGAPEWEDHQRELENNRLLREHLHLQGLLSQVAYAESYELGTPMEGLSEDLAVLRVATKITREEANTADLRITNTPWCYTRGTR